MKSRLFLVSAAAIVVAAFAWAGCSSDDSSGGEAGAAGAAGAGKGGAAGKGGSAQGGSPNQGGSAQGGSAQGGSSNEGGSAQGGSAQGGSAQGGSGGGGEITLPAGCYLLAGLPCNPLTNDGCDSAAGQACDFADDQGNFQCWDPPPPNDIDIGGTCSSEHMCKGGGTCMGDGVCEKFCCADTDCPADKKCVGFGDTIGTLGTCTTPPPPPADAGTPCTKAEECGDTETMICDPAGTGCQAAQCDGTTDCAAGKVCLGQVSSPTIGACYTECTAFPTASGCATGETCVSSLGRTKGACYKLGTGADGAACTPIDDVSTGCVAGLVCAEEGADSKCRVPCDPWGTPACGANLACDVVNSACIAGAEAVAIGAACTGDDFAPCGVDAGKVKGFCLSSVCTQWCRPNEAGDCPTGKTCTGSVGASLDTIIKYCK